MIFYFKLLLTYFSEKKVSGSSDNGRDSPGQHECIKCGNGSLVHAGDILATQRGTKYIAGTNAYISRNNSIHAKISGIVKIATQRVKTQLRYRGKTRYRSALALSRKEVVISVIAISSLAQM